MARASWLLAGLLPALVVVVGCGSAITSQSSEKAANVEEAFVRVGGMGRQNGFL